MEHTYFIIFYACFNKKLYKRTREVTLCQFSRDIYKYVAIAILPYIILFYCIILLLQFLN